jgi:DNA invertase Pin-like site-specific DNA recombinase
MNLSISAPKVGSLVSLPSRFALSRCPSAAFNRLNIEFVSFREQIDTGGPLGRAIVVIIGAIAELERNLIIERVRAGMRRARLEGTHIGRNPLTLDHEAIHRERCQGQSLRQIAKGHRISAATVQRVLRKQPAPIPVQDLQKTA